MTIDASIFNPPFLSTEKLQPTREQLAAFLESGGKGPDALLDKELASFRTLLTSRDAVERAQLPEARQEDVQNYLFIGALHYSQFAGQALLSTIELFRYQMHALRAIDLNTPASFIQAAEQTMRKLNKKKIEDALRMVRLQEMISERKKILEKRRPPWEELAAELCRIAQYLTDNLAKIASRCEASIIMLSDLSITGQKEQLLAEDLKTHFKDQAKKALHSGKGTMQDIQHFLQESNQVVEEMAIAVREDVNTLTGLYEALHDHLRTTIQKIRGFQTAIETNKGAPPEEKGPLFRRLEQALVSLLSVRRLEQQATGIHTETTHEPLILQKRKEMLDYLFEVAQRERRSPADRRSQGDRRRFADPNYHGPERRSGKDRRSGKNRRAG